MDRLTEWASGKPLLLSMVAQAAALAAPDVYELLHLVVNEDVRVRGPRRHEHADWSLLYSNHRLSRRSVLASLGVRARRVEEIELTLNSMTWFSRAEVKLVEEAFREITPDQWTRARANACRMVNWALLKHKQGLMADTNVGFFGNVNEVYAVASLSFRFFMRVELPCFILYGKWPSRLLFEATRRKSPNWRALESLVRLDKHVLHHPRVHWLLHEAPHQIRKIARARVANSLSRGPTRLSKKNVKYRISRLIARVSERFGFRLREPDIRALFDAVAHGRCGSLIDADLPSAPETFSKAIQRDRTFWDLPPQPDTKTLERVRALRGRFA